MSLPDSAVAPRYLRMPHVERGMTVGLFGGSFDPAHEGHLHVARTALRRVGLDRLWWIVTPGNPLKAGRKPASLADRIAASQALASEPRIDVTAFEAGQKLTYTADMIAHVLARNPGVRFVWVMGADNLAGFHTWHRWRDIAASVALAVIDRPGASGASLSAPAARALSRFRIDEKDARLLPRLVPPAWTFIHARRSPLSSTALRALS